MSENQAKTEAELIAEFKAAVRPYDLNVLVKVVNAMTPGTNYRGCSKQMMAESWAAKASPFKNGRGITNLTLKQITDGCEEFLKKHPKFQKAEKPALEQIERGIEALKCIRPGRYRLACDVVNPAKDLRVRYDWRVQQLVKAGTYDVLEDFVHMDEKEPIKVGIRIHQKASHYYNSQYLRVPHVLEHVQKESKTDKGLQLALLILANLEYVGEAEKTETTKEKLGRIEGELDQAVSLLRESVKLLHVDLDLHKQIESFLKGK